jgi:hypothetical protein
LKLVFPGGDERVSALQELQLQGEASDDFGLLKYGVGYSLSGQDPRLVELGGPAPANQKRTFSYVLALEDLGVQEDQLIGYFVWADDYGPDGRQRRSFSDIFFAEVRPFEEIFRPEQSGMAESDSQGQQENPGVKLAELQKEIVVATWNLERQQSTPSHIKSK